MTQCGLGEFLVSAQPEEEECQGNGCQDGGGPGRGEQGALEMNQVGGRTSARRRKDGLGDFVPQRNNDFFGLEAMKSQALCNQAQFLIHLSGGLEALFRMEVQGTLDEVLQRAGQGGIQGTHRLVTKGKRRRRLACDHFVQQDAQGENIAAWVGAPAAFILFWGGIACCAQRLGVAACIGKAAAAQPASPGRRVAARGGGAGNAEIDHDRPAIGR
jgi:hypothetical protein